MTAALDRIPVTSPAAVAVFQKILTHGPIARIDVARRTGLSQAAVTKAVNPLIESGFVTEALAEDQREEAAAPGRPVSPLVVSPGRSSIVGVKVTADQTYAVLTDLAAHVVAATSRPNASSDVDDIFANIEQIVVELSERAPRGVVDGVGVSVSGDVDAARGVVRDSPLLGWHAVPLQELLEARLGIPVTVENDVRALTHAEQLFGVGRDAGSFAVVTIGEGVGCGIFVNGDVVEGSRGVAGEIGHLPLAPGNLVCSCGRRGCVETIAATRSIVNSVRVVTGDPRLRLDDVIRLAREGMPAAVSAFAAAGETIGAALAALVNLVGPEMVIIAGEGVEEFDLYGEKIREAFGEHAFGSAIECSLVLHSHTFDDWSRGAAVGVIRRIAGGTKGA